MRISTYRAGRPTSAQSTGRTTGFTLLEVLVVVAILVILAGVGGTILFGAKEGAEKDIALTKIKSLENVCMQYDVRFKSFPSSLNDLVSPPDGGKSYVDPTALIDPWKNPFQYDPQGGQNGRPRIWSNGPTPGNPNGVISNDR